MEMMMRIGFVSAGILVVMVAGFLPSESRAAESYDNCTGYIDSVPTVITTQGTWCLRSNVSAALTSGYAIDIQTSNVTIDCNDFKIGGLAAGDGTTAAGIFAAGKSNITVRQCNVRGFMSGIKLLPLDDAAGGGHVVEDNRLDNNTFDGIYVDGDGSVIRRNIVADTGGSTILHGNANAISSFDGVDVIDNTISGVSPLPDDAGNSFSVGVYAGNSTGGSISGNRVRAIASHGEGSSAGIYSIGDGRVVFRGNDVIGIGANGAGITCLQAGGIAKDNIAVGFPVGISGCFDGGGNVTD
ncbi:right-handed parallel beta-helix repeat-containing protein [Luteimonas salinilitoris]|uniref:Right-handed parallel beta-helix repeat-containing protein n=1 Tax=Luteimonas salinilitoris TaxID=3237697 RepID=A0ABV4HZU8_9GAMM